MGKLFVVGIGSGGPDGMTIAARRALEAADIVVGYTKYVELALAAVPDAAHLATPMMHEVERCRLAPVSYTHLVLLNGCGHLLVVVVGGEQRVAERDFVDVFLRVVVEIIDELVERCTLC